MSSIQQQYNSSFVISLGDQYDASGVQLTNPLSDLNTSSDLSHRFTDHFENVYNPSLAPWYLILGEQDLKGSVQALFQYSKLSNRWNMPYNYYYKDFTVSYTKSIRVIFIDTTSIMCHHQDKDNLDPDSLETFACDDAWYFMKDDQKSKYNEKDEEKFVDRDEHLKWIRDTIVDADNDRTISNIFIAGHHCLWSKGFHGCPMVMGSKLRPLLELSRKIKGYFCGHNHGLEHFQWTQMKGVELHQFVVGSGAMFSKMDEGRCDLNGWIHETSMSWYHDSKIESKYVGASLGFVSVHFDTSIVVKFWNEDAEVLYEAII